MAGRHPANGMAVKVMTATIRTTKLGRVTLVKKGFNDVVIF
jgi:hypothetical protein